MLWATLPVWPMINFPTATHKWHKFFYNKTEEPCQQSFWNQVFGLAYKRQRFNGYHWPSPGSGRLCSGSFSWLFLPLLWLVVQFAGINRNPQQTPCVFQLVVELPNVWPIIATHTQGKPKMPVIPERTAYKHDVISAPSCIASSAVLYKWIEILRALPLLDT